MAEYGQKMKLALIADPVTDDRLSPAEAHRLILQKLEQLVVPWGLDPTDVHRLARQLYVHSYRPGEIIVPHGVPAGCLGLVVRGQVAASRRSGRVSARSERPEIVLRPGDTFGEAMLLQGQPSSRAWQALTPCEIWFLNRADLLAVRAERQARHRLAMVRRLTILTGWLVGLLLLAMLSLLLPATRRIVALLPMGLGQWCVQHGHDDCAEWNWTLAAGLAPADANPPLALGTLYFRQGEIGAAERSFEAARKLAPDSPEVLNNLGLIYASQGDHRRAISAFQTALELEPGVAAVEYNLGLSFQALGEHDEALSHFQTALALGETGAEALVNLAIAYYETDRPEQAAAAARRALLDREDLAPAHVVLGAVALELQRPEEAVAELRRAIALDSDSSEAHFYLGLAYDLSGQPTAAILAFERALATAGDEVARVRIRRYLNELYEQSSGRSPGDR